MSEVKLYKGDCLIEMNNIPNIASDRIKQAQYKEKEKLF